MLAQGAAVVKGGGGGGIVLLPHRVAPHLRHHPAGHQAAVGGVAVFLAEGAAGHDAPVQLLLGDGVVFQAAAGADAVFVAVAVVMEDVGVGALVGAAGGAALVGILPAGAAFGAVILRRGGLGLGGALGLLHGGGRRSGLGSGRSLGRRSLGRRSGPGRGGGLGGGGGLLLLQGGNARLPRRGVGPDAGRHIARLRGRRWGRLRDGQGARNGDLPHHQAAHAQSHRRRDAGLCRGRQPRAGQQGMCAGGQRRGGEDLGAGRRLCPARRNRRAQRAAEDGVAPVRRKGVPVGAVLQRAADDPEGEREDVQPHALPFHLPHACPQLFPGIPQPAFHGVLAHLQRLRDLRHRQLFIIKHIGAEPLFLGQAVHQPGDDAARFALVQRLFRPGVRIGVGRLGGGPLRFVGRRERHLPPPAGLAQGNVVADAHGPAEEFFRFAQGLQVLHHQDGRFLHHVLRAFTIPQDLERHKIAAVFVQGKQLPHRLVVSLLRLLHKQTDALPFTHKRHLPSLF